MVAIAAPASPVTAEMLQAGIELVPIPAAHLRRDSRLQDLCSSFRILQSLDHCSHRWVSR